ncbi:MAG: hypothetical protein AAGH49_02870 [Pseudomonadota bacterium]
MHELAEIWSAFINALNDMMGTGISPLDAVASVVVGVSLSAVVRHVSLNVVSEPLDHLFRAFRSVFTVFDRLPSISKLAQVSLSMFLGRAESEDVIEQLITLYETVWIPRYGVGFAKVLLVRHTLSVLINKLLSLLWSPLKWLLAFFGAKQILQLLSRLLSGG